MKLFLIKQSVGNSPHYVLQGDDYKHLILAKRMAPGDSIKARDADKRHVLLTIQRVDASVAQALCVVSPLTDVPQDIRPAAVGFSLVQGLPKGKKTDQIIRQAVESGASEIILVKTRYSVPEISDGDFDKKSQRWKSIIEEAVQQSGSPHMPGLRFFPSIDAMLKGSIPGGGLGLYFHQERRSDSSLHQLLRPYTSSAGGRIYCFVGPEGGFSEDECQKLEAAAFHAVFFGDTILRTETAGIYALGAVRTIVLEGRHWQPSL